MAVTVKTSVERYGEITLDQLAKLDLPAARGERFIEGLASAAPTRDDDTPVISSRRRATALTTRTTSTRSTRTTSTRSRRGQGEFVHGALPTD